MYPTHGRSGAIRDAFVECLREAAAGLDTQRMVDAA
jgi:ribosomal protein L35AE/L33A